MNKVKDNYKEHELHNTYESVCSTCFSENLIIKSKRECIGCNSTDLTRCDGMMCEVCWSNETNDGLE